MSHKNISGLLKHRAKQFGWAEWIPVSQVKSHDNNHRILRKESAASPKQFKTHVLLLAGQVHLMNLWVKLLRGLSYQQSGNGYLFCIMVRYFFPCPCMNIITKGTPCRKRCSSGHRYSHHILRACHKCSAAGAILLHTQIEIIHQ